MALTNAQVRDIENVVHPYTPLHKLRETGVLILESGRGVFVYDNEGNEYIEGMSGLWCTSLGWGDEELIEAGVEQLRKLPYYHNFGAKATEPSAELAEKLKEIAPFRVARTFFTSSGSEANDTQIKLAWYYNNALGRHKKKKIISRVKAYHGVTIASASLTGLPPNHLEWDLPLDFVKHTTCPHHYRFGQEGESEADFVQRCVQDLKDLIEAEGADTIAAMIAEPVMGAGGVIVPPEEYYEAMQAVLSEHDILMIADEVITGFGRTGNVFGCETMGMKPDTMSVAKQLTSAYAPLGAVMLPDHMYEAMEANSAKVGTFGHGFTYGGHPLGCAMGVKAIEIYEKRNVLGNVRDRAPIFTARMEKLKDHPLVGDVRCKGLIGGLEIVADKATKRSFNPKQGVALKCSEFLQNRGAILRPIGDTMALCPPMIVKDDELNALFDRLEKSLDDTEAWVAREGMRAEAS